MIAIENLNLNFKNKRLLENVSFSLENGETLAIIGESGSGKSLLSRSLIRLFGEDYSLNAQRFLVAGEEPLKLKERDLRNFRSRVALILQDAHLSFYPFLDVGSMFHIVLKSHTNLDEKQRKQRAFECFENLGFKDLDLLWHSYAHQLSVGMMRRVNLALALVCDPKYLICDEITASLDKENELRIFKLLMELKKQVNLVLVTHDLNLAQKLSDRILLFGKGRVLQNLPTESFFKGSSDWVRVYKEFYA